MTEWKEILYMYVRDDGSSLPSAIGIATCPDDRTRGSLLTATYPNGTLLSNHIALTLSEVRQLAEAFNELEREIIENEAGHRKALLNDILLWEPSIPLCIEMEKTGYMVFSGNQWNEAWRWCKDRLNDLNVVQLEAIKDRLNRDAE